MAEHDEDRRVSRRYGELEKEEPPSALDARILAAARGAPRRARRWQLPFAAAAVIVLAVGVTYQLQREQPDTELAVPQPPPEARREAPAVPKEEPTARPAAPRPAPSAQKPRIQREAAPPADAARGTAPAAEASGAARAESMVGEESPERWLERIIELRRAGHDQEADESLAGFRKRYPEREVPLAALRR